VLTVGLTGNYGMGKSTVLGMFRKLGAFTVGADELVDRLLGDAGVLERLRGVLGETVFSGDGSLDRARVASIIFRDKGKREAVEGILHPLVFERIDEVLVERGKNGNGVVIIEVPLLFETGSAGRFQRTVTVYADEETALRRLEKKGIGRADAQLRMNAQMAVTEKRERSDFSIDNSGTSEETEQQVSVVYRKLMEEAGNGDDKRA
jgi:dephospho-CoA kinase